MYKRQELPDGKLVGAANTASGRELWLSNGTPSGTRMYEICLLYTSDAADERSSVDLGGRRIIKKNKHIDHGAR